MGIAEDSAEGAPCTSQLGRPVSCMPKMVHATCGVLWLCKDPCCACSLFRWHHLLPFIFRNACASGAFTLGQP